MSDETTNNQTSNLTEAEKSDLNASWTQDVANSLTNLEARLAKVEDDLENLEYKTKSFFAKLFHPSQWGK
jgi:hypothetical protein